MKPDSLIFAPIPLLYIGVNKFNALTDIIKPYGKKTLVITGASSFTSSRFNDNLIENFSRADIQHHYFKIDREPSPSMIDLAVDSFREFAPDSVVAIGGGSALDAGKAISAMLPLNEPVKNYLEGVGSGAVHPGSKIPFIAVPSTSGTGSETTRNAVLSEIGEQGYKRSLRHYLFVANAAILDPQLMISCPPATTAASGMDAFTQLLESYLSTAANPWTDTLALDGLKRISSSLLTAFHNGGNVESRIDIALAACFSGITLTNVGLGTVHGLAAPIGGLRPIPHGVICSALMPVANLVTVRKLRQKASWHPALPKYAVVGKMFTKITGKSDEFYTDLFLDTIAKYHSEMNIPRLGNYGLTRADISKIAITGENKNNPIPLDNDELLEVMERAL